MLSAREKQGQAQTVKLGLAENSDHVAYLWGRAVGVGRKARLEVDCPFRSLARLHGGEKCRLVRPQPFPPLLYCTAVIGKFVVKDLFFCAVDLPERNFELILGRGTGLTLYQGVANFVRPACNI